MQQSGDLLNVEQAARLLSIEVSTLRKWVHSKDVPYVKIGKCLRFRRESLLWWIEQQEKMTLARRA